MEAVRLLLQDVYPLGLQQSQMPPWQYLEIHLNCLVRDNKIVRVCDMKNTVYFARPCERVPISDTVRDVCVRLISQLVSI